MPDQSSVQDPALKRRRFCTGQYLRIKTRKHLIHMSALVQYGYPRQTRLLAFQHQKTKQCMAIQQRYTPLRIVVLAV